MIRNLTHSIFTFSSAFPRLVTSGVTERVLKVVHSSEKSLLPEKERVEFTKNNKVKYDQDGVKFTVVSEKAVDKVKISKNTQVIFSQAIQK